MTDRTRSIAGLTCLALSFLAFLTATLRSFHDLKGLGLMFIAWGLLGLSYVILSKTKQWRGPKDA